jgi:hypothetical protein
VGWLDVLLADYTLMTFIIKDLTFKIMLVIIAVFELAMPGEMPTPDPASSHESTHCARRPNFDHPCRLNIDQGWKHISSEACCG